MAKPLRALSHALDLHCAEDFTAENPGAFETRRRSRSDRRWRFGLMRIAWCFQCRFLGWQDTVLANRGRHYFENCYIAGHVVLSPAARRVLSAARFDYLKDGCMRRRPLRTQASSDMRSIICEITGAPGRRPVWKRPWRDFAATVYHTGDDGRGRPTGGLAQLGARWKRDQRAMRSSRRARSRR